MASSESFLPIARRRPLSPSETFISSASYSRLESVVTVTGARGADRTRRSAALSNRVSPLMIRKSSFISARAIQQVARLSDTA